MASGFCHHGKISYYFIFTVQKYLFNLCHIHPVINFHVVLPTAFLLANHPMLAGLHFCCSQILSNRWYAASEVAKLYSPNMPTRHCYEVQKHKAVPLHAEQAQKGGKTSTTRGWVVSTMLPAGLLYHRKETQYPLYRRIGGPWSWSEWVQNISTQQSLNLGTPSP